MATAPIPIGPAPVVPDASKAEADFDADYEERMRWEGDVLVPGINALAENVYSNALAAADDAATAQTAAGQAGLHATSAGTAAIAASDSADAAAASAAEAASLMQLYLGPLDADPATGRGGAPLVAGSWYQRIGGFIRSYNGSAWVQGLSAVAGVSTINNVSGEITLKTINGFSLLGAGNLSVGFTVVSTSSPVFYQQSLVDTRVGAITLTLPASPVEEESYQFFDAAGTFGTNSLTVAGNGKSFKDVFGYIFTEDLIIDVSGVSVSIFYDGIYWRFQ